MPSQLRNIGSFNMHAIFRSRFRCPEYTAENFGSVSSLWSKPTQTEPDVDMNPGERSSNAEVSCFRDRVDDLVSKTDDVEQRMNQVVQFYATKEEEANRNIENGNARAHKRVTFMTRMQKLMLQFGKILKQISNDKLSEPFMLPVDVKGLGLDDYYEVISKPMDFSTIRSKMEAGGYNHVREIYSDLRLVFTNAMTYNEEGHVVHEMASELLDKLEFKWQKLLPKVEEEEKLQVAAPALANIKMAQESAIARTTRDINYELNELNMQLEELREMVVQKCRKFSVYEKRELGAQISSLSPEDLDKALEIIAQNNPSFHATENTTEVDMDAQTQTTLWKLKFFVKRALECQPKNITLEENLKRKNEICNVLAMNATKKRKKKLSSQVITSQAAS